MPNKLISLEIVRGVAAFTVAITHYMIRIDSEPIYEFFAVVAVEIFFPLSGFVLAGQIFLVLRQRQMIGTFLVRRWMRTLPPYLVALIVISIYLDKLVSYDFLQYLFFFRYINTLYEIGDYYPVAWSLAVEEWYYIAFPTFLLLMGCKSNKKISLIVTSILFVAIFILLRTFYYESPDNSFLRIASFLRLDAICIGFLCFILLGARKSSPMLIAILSLTLILSLLLFLITSRSVFLLETSRFWLIILPIWFGLLITLLSHVEKFWPNLFTHKSTIVGRWLGQISYSVYLYHLIIIYLFFPNSGRESLIYYVFILGLFCTIFYHLFEKPIMAIRPRYRSFPNH